MRCVRHGPCDARAAAAKPAPTIEAPPADAHASPKGNAREDLAERDAVGALGQWLDAARAEATGRAGEVAVAPDAVTVSSGAGKEALFKDAQPTGGFQSPPAGWTSGPDLPHWVQVHELQCPRLPPLGPGERLKCQGHA